MKNCNDNDPGNPSGPACEDEADRAARKRWVKPQLRRITFATKAEEARFHKEFLKNRK